MKIISKYILKKFIFYVLIILLALELFFVGMDLISNISSLPQSANIKLLYIVFVALFALTITLPLAIVFGWLMTLISFIKSNELVAFIALGAKAKDILMPPFIATLAILVALIALQTSPLAYAADYKSKILNNEYFVSEKNNVFFKFDNYFVYFDKLLPLQKEAVGVNIFKIEKNNLVENIKAPKGYFQDNHWEFENAQIIKKPSSFDWKTSKLQIQTEPKIALLEGFKPKILNTVYEPKSGYSIVDAIDSFMLLDNQNINTAKIRASLYNQLFVPFFIIPIMAMAYFYVNINNRFFRMAEFASTFVFVTLIIWGALFLLFRLSSNSVMPPELAMLTPLGLLFMISFLLILKRKASI